MRNTIIGGVAGITIGVFAAKWLGQPSAPPSPEPTMEIAATTNATSNTAKATNEKPSEQQLLLMAINELNLTTEELESAKANLSRMERKAKRYDWLRDNGLQGSHSMSFDERTFEPRQKLLDFLGLDENEAEAMKRASTVALDDVRRWENENAVLKEESETNRVYEISGLPESYKQAFIAELGTVLHEEDVQLLLPSLHGIFPGEEIKRVVSASIITAEDYAEQLKHRGGRSYGAPSDMIKISVEKMNAEGRRMGTRSSVMGLNHLSPSGFHTRWDHLFNLDSFSQ